MKRAFAIGLLLLATVSAADDIVDDVRCREIGFSRAAETQDAELFATFIDADARFVGTTVLRGPAAVAAAWAVFFTTDGPRIKWRPQFVEVLDDGALALTRGPYRLISTDAQGAKSEHWGTFNSVWRRQTDGSWKIVFDAGSDGAAPSDAIRALLDRVDDCDRQDAAAPPA